MKSYEWYQTLIRPSWAPPSWIFSPVWTILYLIIIFSFGYVFLKIIKKQYPKSVAIPFILNLIFNFLFTPLQFGLRSNLLAAIDILLVLFTMLWSFKVIWPLKKAVVISNIPYLLWVSFATVLQLTVTYLNM